MVVAVVEVVDVRVFTVVSMIIDAVTIAVVNFVGIIVVDVVVDVNGIVVAVVVDNEVICIRAYNVSRNRVDCSFIIITKRINDHRGFHNIILRWCVP